MLSLPYTPWRFPQLGPTQAAHLTLTSDAPSSRASLEQYTLRSRLSKYTDVTGCGTAAAEAATEAAAVEAVSESSRVPPAETLAFCCRFCPAGVPCCCPCCCCFWKMSRGRWRLISACSFARS